MAISTGSSRPSRCARGTGWKRCRCPSIRTTRAPASTGPGCTSGGCWTWPRSSSWPSSPRSRCGSSGWSARSSSRWASSSWVSAWWARSSSICARRIAARTACASGCDRGAPGGRAAASGPHPIPEMQRDLSRLTGTTHDVIVVGGGIQGVWIAWDAALRGLSVALLERDDFGAATSANSLRIVHGGLRYLARGDLPRMRESIRERAALLRVAPSLVEPLPVLIPTVGAGTQSRMAMGAALRLNDLGSFDRNRGLRPDRRLPRGRLVAADECRRLFPAFPPSSGGALWYDARLSHPERLTLAIARAAAGRGAAVANYCRVERLVSDGGRVRGVVATDLEAGGELEIRGRTVVIAAGPWTP